MTSSALFDPYPSAAPEIGGPHLYYIYHSLMFLLC